MKIINTTCVEVVSGQESARPREVIYIAYHRSAAAVRRRMALTTSAIPLYQAETADQALALLGCSEDCVAVRAVHNGIINARGVPEYVLCGVDGEVWT